MGQEFHNTYMFLFCKECDQLRVPLPYHAIYECPQCKNQITDEQLLDIEVNE